MKLEYEVHKDDFARAGEASSKIKSILKQLGIPTQVVRKIAIATYEAEINVVIHSLGGRIIASVESDRIEIQVKDDGPGIENIDDAMTEGWSTANNAARELGFGAGMGLPNMKRCCDEFYIESEPGKYTHLRMIMNL